MCGFFLTNDPLFNESYYEVVESRLRFRGPDYSSGVIIYKGWSLYHSRLSIIDVEGTTANQPLFSCAGGVLVFNGEILNYKEISERFFDGTHISDTKLLLDFIESDFFDLNLIDGFFAFCYVNSDGELKHCARDKFGVKPLFTYQRSKFISISSEPALLKDIFNLGLNSDALEEYKCLRAPVFSSSYFDGVTSVQPGSCLIKGDFFDPINFMLSEYCEPDNEKLQTVLENAIKTRSVSDVPIGLLLSRGIDSNLTKHLGTFDRFYTIGFEGDEDIEYLASQSVDNLSLMYCTPSQYRQAFEYLLELRGEPLSVPNEVLLYCIAKKASEDGIKVLLSGEGADEFFGGYDRIFQWAANASCFNLDEFIELYCYSKPTVYSSVYKKLKNLFDNKPDYSPFELVRWFFIRYHMPVLFRRLDFSLMAAGVEGREPLANMHTFIQAVSYNYPSLMTKSGLGKLPLREIMAKFEGNEFAFEKKVGFPVDLKKVYPEYEHQSSYEIWFQKNIKVLEK